MTDILDTLQTIPHPLLDCAHNANKEPIFAKLNILHTQLNINAISIHSDGGNGCLGHRRLNATLQRYQIKSQNEVDFAALTNSRATLTIPTTHLDQSAESRVPFDRKRLLPDLASTTVVASDCFLF